MFENFLLAFVLAFHSMAVVLCECVCKEKEESSAKEIIFS